MIARVRVVIETPFDFDVGQPDENGNNPLLRDAAEYAETTVLQSVKDSIINLTKVTGTVMDEHCAVEEVRQT